MTKRSDAEVQQRTITKNISLSISKQNVITGNNGYHPDMWARNHNVGLFVCGGCVTEAISRVLFFHVELGVNSLIDSQSRGL